MGPFRVATGTVVGTAYTTERPHHALQFQTPDEVADASQTVARNSLSQWTKDWGKLKKGVFTKDEYLDRVKEEIRIAKAEGRERFRKE